MLISGPVELVEMRASWPGHSKLKKKNINLFSESNYQRIQYPCRKIDIIHVILKIIFKN